MSGNAETASSVIFESNLPCYLFISAQDTMMCFVFPEDVARLVFFFSKTMSKTTAFEKLVAYIFFWSSCEYTKHKESNPIRLLSIKSSWKPYKSSSPLLALFITLIDRAVYLEKNTSKHFIKFYRKMFSGSRKVWVELVYLNKFVFPIWAFAIGNYQGKWFLSFEVLLRYKMLWFPECVCVINDLCEYLLICLSWSVNFRSGGSNSFQPAMVRGLLSSVTFFSELWEIPASF